MHLLSLISSDSTLPQLAQVVMIVSAEDDNMVNVVMRDAVRCTVMTVRLKIKVIVPLDVDK